MSTPTAFSSQAINYIVNSDWLNPSNYQERTLDDATPETIAARTAKGWTHTLGKPIRAVTRIVGIVAISTLVAPVGVLYNGYQLASYGIASKFSSGHRSHDNQEKVNQYAKAFFTDLLFVGLAATTAMLPLSIMGLVHPMMSQIGLFGTLVTGLFGVPEFAVELTQKNTMVLATYLKNNFGLVAQDKSILDFKDTGPIAPPAHRSAVYNQMFKKQGLYYTFEKAVTELRLQSAQKLMDAISAFNKKQGFAKAIPYHYPPNINKIVDYLKENNKDFGMDESQFTSLINEIQTQGSLYEDAHNACRKFIQPDPVIKEKRPYIFSEDEVKAFFETTQGELRIVQDYKKSLPSLTLWVFKQIHSSEWLYPSNAELRPVIAKESLKESIGDNTKLFDRTLRTSAWHTAGKPIRALARAVAFAAGVAICAPVGVAWHGVNTLFFLGKAIVQCTSDNSKHNWMKVGDHAKAFFSDLTAAALIYLGLYLGMAIPEIIAQREYTAAAGLACMNFLPLLVGFVPQYITPFLAWGNERAPLIKSMALRNDCGITATDGSLLPYDEIVDQEDMKFTGHLAKLLIAQGVDLLYMIQELQEKLPPRYKLTQENPLFIMTKVEALKGKVDPSVNIDDWLERYKKLKENYDWLQNLLKTCLEAKEKMLFDNRQVTITMPPFICRDDYTASAFQCGLPARDDPWKKCLEKAKASLDEGLQESPSPRFAQIRQAVINQGTPWQVLGLKEESPAADIRKAYRLAILAVAPDLIPDENVKKQAEILFNCVTEAYNALSNNK